MIRTLLGCPLRAVPLLVWLCALAVALLAGATVAIAQDASQVAAAPSTAADTASLWAILAGGGVAGGVALQVGTKIGTGLGRIADLLARVVSLAERMWTAHEAAQLRFPKLEVTVRATPELRRLLERVAPQLEDAEDLDEPTNPRHR